MKGNDLLVTMFAPRVLAVPRSVMHSVYILRRDLRDARRTQAAIEATRDLRVAGVATSLAQADTAPTTADVLIIDLRLADGPALPLVQQLRARRAGGGRTRVLLVTLSTDDPQLWPALRAGADSYILDADASTAPAPVVARLLRGEAAASAALARQLLAFFGEANAVTAASPANERALDWVTDAQNPLRLSRAERHLLVLLAQGHGVAPIAVRMGVSVESIGRRIANVYRKLQWDLRSGALSLQAA
jgi:DNA-binding NarL/FixJ family response regulator